MPSLDTLRIIQAKAELAQNQAARCRELARESCTPLECARYENIANAYTQLAETTSKTLVLLARPEQRAVLRAAKRQI